MGISDYNFTQQQMVPNINANNWTLPANWSSNSIQAQNFSWNNSENFWNSGNAWNFGSTWDAFKNPMSPNSSNDSNDSISQGKTNNNPTFTSKQIEDAKKTVSEYYAKVIKDPNNISTAIGATGSFVAMENLHKLRHPVQSYQAAKKADKIFKPAATMDAKRIAVSWKNNPEEIKKAYNEVLHAYRSLEKKNKYFSGWWRKTWTGNDKAYIEGLIKDLQSAMKSGNMEQVVKITSELEQTKAFNGKIPTAMKWVKEKFTRNVKPSLGAEARVTKNIETVNKTVEGFKKAQAATGLTQKALRFGSKALKELKGFAIFDGLIETATKIIPAYKNGGTDKGNKQLVQSGVKVVASCGAWAIGRTAGTALGAKLGAAIGTAVCPGLGTALGAVIGIGLGCLASWGAEKVVEHFIPVDESEKLEAKATLNTSEGKNEAIKTLAQLEQSGAEIPEDVVNSAKILSYSA